MSNEDLARLVARLGLTVQALNGVVQGLSLRVRTLEAELTGAKRRHMKRMQREVARRAVERQLRRAAITERGEKLQPAVPIAQIVSEVSVEFGIEVTVILGRAQVREVTVARQEVYMRAHEEGHSSAKIGQAMGRNHATVLCGMKSVAMRRAIAARRKAVADA
ncbi:MAG: helix-turn-helix domain-containing protein [Aquabacterium sp.]|uniref:helix-turn-helix domain-containing protein n=1 Tax=Aquabacterium sp. TaxID=1872578 RepID=UPI0027275B8A|nr:helix-turn-helix domain-containing protein [Aquabacterium sp.]MDO9006339.1 helix-turn-helix domain-containing protein [Aquabacterium sp.]